MGYRRGPGSERAAHPPADHHCSGWRTIPDTTFRAQRSESIGEKLRGWIWGAAYARPREPRCRDPARQQNRRLGYQGAWLHSQRWAESFPLIWRVGATPTAEAFFPVPEFPPTTRSPLAM